MSAITKIRSEGSRWYWPNGTMCYDLPKKSGPGLKKPTVREARELGLLPSVTTILRILDKPALNRWKTDQACLAVLTTPKKEGEPLDEFINRVLNIESVQDEEAKLAADKGTAVHDAIEDAIQGKEINPDLRPYVEPVMRLIRELGRVVWSEKVLVGDGYSGRGDILVEDENTLFLLDFKTSKTMPEKDSWPEHRLQTSAYAATVGNTNGKMMVTGNIYISTVLPGETRPFLQHDWKETYEKGFRKILEVWRFLNNMGGEV